jgi:hypothetical protein
MNATHCYVGFKACGCMVAACADIPEWKEDTAECVADFIKNGYRVERVERKNADLRICKCVPPDDLFAKEMNPKPKPSRIKAALHWFTPWAFLLVLLGMLYASDWLDRKVPTPKSEREQMAENCYKIAAFFDQFADAARSAAEEEKQEVKP